MLEEWSSDAVRRSDVDDRQSETVWAVLSDGASGAAWDSGVDAVAGQIAVGGSAVHLREEYTGPLVRLIWRSLPDPGPSFDRFAQRLGQRVGSGG